MKKVNKQKMKLHLDMNISRETQGVLNQREASKRYQRHHKREHIHDKGSKRRRKPVTLQN